jgi:class 3 adenylate cyclase
MFGFGNIRSGISEQEFITEYNHFSYRAILAGTIFGLLFFNAYAIYDYFIQPDSFFEHTLIRLGFVTPVCISIIIFLRRPKNRVFTRLAVLLGALTLALSTVYFYQDNLKSFTKAAPVGLVFMILYILTSMRFLRREAWIFVATTMAAIVLILAQNNVHKEIWMSYLFHTGLASAMGLAICHTLERSWRKMVEQKKIAERQEAAATKLLESIFPVSIANRLRKSSDAIAERCEFASILFADIQGFTAMSGKLPPDKLVHDLDIIFSRIDDLCAQNGCEKIKTIGDSYMAVSGVPTLTTDHAERIVRLALAMQALSKELTIGGQPVTFRIGIHSGPVVAGVIGKSRFAYDLWGDSVNMASRMESIAPPGSIQISSDTANLLGNAFDLTPRGKIQVKGKGEVTTWLVTGEASQHGWNRLENDKKSA